MRVVAVKAGSVLEIETRTHMEQVVAHAQPLVLYPAAKNRRTASQELAKLVEHLGSM